MYTTADGTGKSNAGCWCG